MQQRNIGCAGNGNQSGRLRVALVTETFPPEINGVAMTLGRLVEGLRSRGHQVLVIRPRQDDDRRSQAHQLLRPGLAIPGYPLLRMGLPCGAALAGAFARFKPDVVHVATEGPLGLSALRAAGRRPVTSTFHTNFHQYAQHYHGAAVLARPIDVYLRRFHNRTRVTLAPTAALCAALEARGFHHCRVLARGVDAGIYDPERRSVALRASWGAGPEDPVLLIAGRLAAEKNLDLGLRAWRALCERMPKARLVLVGDGPERARLAGVPGLILTGFLDSQHLAEAYASADVFLFPSLTETYGNVLMEAMASGLPGVAFDYAACRTHVRDGLNGRSVACDDEAAFVAASVEMGTDSELRRRLGTAARETALGIGWDRVVDVFEDALRTAMLPRARRGHPQRRAA